MSDKRQPAVERRESLSGSAGENKGAVVISGTSMPEGYEPPSGALRPPPAPVTSAQSPPVTSAADDD